MMEEVCAECGFDESSTSHADVAVALRKLTSEVVDTVRSISPDRLRRRPRAEVWAPLEYLGHLRESMAFHRWLIEKALAEDGSPSIPMVGPDASVAAAGYADADVNDLAARFDRRVQRLADQLSALPTDTEERVVILGDTSITVALIARSAWHECYHHLGDIRRLAE